ncbi:hypothetical protein GGR50DRAFT_644579 [Xylaria sp. CBS 124048]|nr:hypothetical protein GGR50DRAFT_644579 [Xylaria sp. CBS 124048]
MKQPFAMLHLHFAGAMSVLLFHWRWDVVRIGQERNEGLRNWVNSRVLMTENPSIGSDLKNVTYGVKITTVKLSWKQNGLVME